MSHDTKFPEVVSGSGRVEEFIYGSGVASTLQSATVMLKLLGFVSFGLQAWPLLVVLFLASVAVMRGCIGNARQMAATRTTQPFESVASFPEASIARPPQVIRSNSLPRRSPIDSPTAVATRSAPIHIPTSSVVDDQVIAQRPLPPTASPAQRQDRPPVENSEPPPGGEFGPFGQHAVGNSSNAPAVQRRVPAGPFYFRFGSSFNSLGDSPFGFGGNGPPFAQTPPFAASPGTNILRGMVADPNAVPIFENEGMFDSISGRKFVGICQMPGEPSKRVQLSIDRVRDRGRNINARLTLLEGRRKSLAYTGVIVDNPPRLTLAPVGDPNVIPLFLTQMPWYSNSPTRVTLSIDGAKCLSGVSVSGETFELMPVEHERRQADEPAVETVLHRMQKGDTLAWQIVSEEDTNDDQEQVWTFTQTSVAHRGDFVWKVAEGTKAEGHYSLSANARLTISLGQNGHTKSYGCTIVDEGDGSKLVVTVPKAPVDGETEPSSVEFELQLLESDEVADDSSE